MRLANSHIAVILFIVCRVELFKVENVVSWHGMLFSTFNDAADTLPLQTEGKRRTLSTLYRATKLH